MRIFPDANIFVAAFVWEEGICGEILRALLAEKKHDLILGDWVWDETAETLHEDFKVPLVKIAAFKERILGGARSTKQPTPLALSPYRVSDPDDAVVLSAALTARADVLVTGDRALLDLAEALKAAEGLLIIYPKEFLVAKGDVW